MSGLHRVLATGDRVAFTQMPDYEDITYPFIVLRHLNGVLAEEDTSGSLVETHQVLLSVYAVASGSSGGDLLASTLAETCVSELRSAIATILELHVGKVLKLTEDQGGTEEDPRRDVKSNNVVWRSDRDLEILVSVE